MSKAIDKHFSNLKKLLEIEEKAESERYQEFFLRLSPAQRQETGKALFNMRAIQFHFSPSDHQLVSFVSSQGKDLPLFSLDVGDIVSVSESADDLFGVPSGTVYEKNKEEIVLAFNRRLPDWLVEGGVFHLNIASGRSSYRRVLDTLGNVATAENDRLAFYRDLSFGVKKSNAVSSLALKDISFLNSDLNQWQQEAVQKTLASKDISLIHGPPGTGKSTVLVEIIRQVQKEGKSVFVTTPSNTACDQLLERLVREKVPCIRLGHPARIMRHLHEYTLDYQLANHPYSEIIDQYESEIHLKDKKRSRRQERTWIGKGEWNQTRDEMKFMRNQIKELKKNVKEQLMHGGSVYLGTHLTSLDPFLKSQIFDYVIIDEATQGIEPFSWVPFLFADKMVLAGDHKQLHPTVFSDEAKKGGLNVSLFERFIEKLDEDHKTTLRVQYRMNEKIMNFSSQEFYENKLIADKSVASHVLSDLKGVQFKDEGDDAPVLFIDTAGRGFEEQRKKGSESRYNPEEAQLVTQELKKLLDAGVLPEDVCVISPYRAQVKFIARQIDNRKIEVNSIDGFQGREKEVVIISLVRSNTEGELGFLVDTRRMNVALTRAKRKLIVIGDSATLSSLPFYKKWLKYVESIGAYKSSWDGVE